MFKTKNWTSRESNLRQTKTETICGSKPRLRKVEPISWSNLISWQLRCFLPTRPKKKASVTANVIFQRLLIGCKRKIPMNWAIRKAKNRYLRRIMFKLKRKRHYSSNMRHNLALNSAQLESDLSHLDKASGRLENRAPKSRKLWSKVLGRSLPITILLS